jgi:crotonobetainyl-CoA:carnitine CoA-transferase CaiB-like acyl-CoA transferase
MNAHAAILQALIERERTGMGRGVAVSLFDSLADWMTVPLLHFEYTGKAPARAGLKHPSIAPYGAFATADGTQLVVSVQNEREWASFCATVLGDAAIARDPRYNSNAARCANRAEVDAMVANVFVQATAEVMMARLEAAGTAWARLNGVDGLSGHTQLRRVTARTPSGPVELPASPVRWNGVEPVPLTVPALGADDDAIRAEFA